jgi:hypothetical protein
MRTNVQKGTTKRIGKGEQIWSLVKNATKRDTMQGEAKRKALQDFRKWDNRRCRQYKEKTQQGVVNLKEFVCNYSLVINIVRTGKS